MSALDNITADALALPKDQRFTLAHRLLASVEPETPSDLDSAWDLEIRERIRKYDTGQTTGIPGESVFADLDTVLKQFCRLTEPQR